MDEILRQLDEKIASETAVVDGLRSQLATAETSLNRLEAAKRRLTGEPEPNSKPRVYFKADGGTRAEQVAQYLERNGPSRHKDILKAVMSGQTRPDLIRAMKRRPEWFTQVDGKYSAWTLTEAGRNRHATS